MSEPHFTSPSTTPEGVVRLGRIAIVGTGLMGGSLGMVLKRAGAADAVIGIGRSAEKLELARSLGAIDSWETDLARGVADADLIILCTTIRHIAEQVPHVLTAAGPQAVVTDIGSTKSAIVDAANGDPRFVGGHPMCGSERTGVEAATPLLYQGATWAITPGPASREDAVQTVLALISAAGAVSLRLDPRMHDAMVATTSHLPHVLATALSRTGGEARAVTPELYRMSAGAFADMTRVAASPAEIWRDVCITNREAVLSALDRYQAHLDAARAAIESADAGALEAYFTAGQEQRSVWQKEKRGG